MIYNEERPSNFDQMIGQELVVENIRNQSKRDHFFPVFILCGQYGSGKTTMARLIAMAANCEHKDENGNPCGECASCKAVMEHSADGIIEIDGASNNGVDNIRKLLNQAITVGVFKKKIFVIDEAHMLSKAAFNALLITLENPPEHCIFILCTTEKEALPETVVSRAPVYMFGKISDVQVKKHILTVAQKNEISITEDAAGLLSRYANGAMRNALQLLEHLSLQKEAGEAITDKDVVKLLGISSLEQRAAFLDGCLAMDVKDVALILKECERKGQSLRTFISDVLKMNTEVLLVKAGAEVVGTEHYLKDLHNLSSYPDTDIVKINKVLSAIAATPTNQLSVERIVTELISVAYAKESIAEGQAITKNERRTAQTDAQDMTSAEVPNPEPKEIPAQTEAPVRTEMAVPAAGVEPVTKEEEQNPVKREASAEFQTAEETPFDKEKKVMESESMKGKEADTEELEESDEESEETGSLNSLFGGFGGLFSGLFDSSFDSPEMDTETVVASSGPQGHESDFLDMVSLESDEEIVAYDGTAGMESDNAKSDADESEQVRAESVPAGGKEDADAFSDQEQDEEDTGYLTLEQSEPICLDGRKGWGEMAEEGIVRKDISLPIPETEEELARIYEEEAREKQEKLEKKEEKEAEEQMFRTRADLIDAQEELRKMLENPAFRIWYRKARLVEQNNAIELHFKEKGIYLGALGQVKLAGCKGITVILDK